MAGGQVQEQRLADGGILAAPAALIFPEATSAREFLKAKACLAFPALQHTAKQSKQQILRDRNGPAAPTAWMPPCPAARQ